ncbi:hypothetical protein [Croceicoccus bisphenolivorans]|uniref:hypothetical protein n=1 Tax=Croceicoccus bisphenolivorans TaxID=1783232 RepID=UPI000834D8F4|nr:hypothetical protein [Croceicoccus bisphenolivorans]
MVVSIKSSAPSTAFTMMKPVLFLARMLAREGSFPPSYLGGFERLVNDVLDELSQAEMTDKERDMVRNEVKEIIASSRRDAGLE